jgi:hypothetical protein
MLRSSNEQCAMCLEVQALCLHFFMGNLVPTGLSWMTNFYHAALYKSYRTPNTDYMFANFRDKRIRQNYFKQFRNMFFDTHKGMASILSINFSMQIFLCSALCYLQQKEFKEHIESSQFTMEEIKKVKKLNLE